MTQTPAPLQRRRRIVLVTIDGTVTHFRPGRHSDFTDLVDTPCVRLDPMGPRARAVASER